jgi:hypothetical protein
VRHRASPKFWAGYSGLPTHIRRLADKNHELLKFDPRHPSLQLKRVGQLWSVRVGDHYRALAVDDEPDGLYWFWIGTHAEYDKIVGRGGS